MGVDGFLGTTFLTGWDARMNPTKVTYKLGKLLRRPQLLIAMSESVLLLASAEVSVRLVDLSRAAQWFGATLEFTETPPSLAIDTLAMSPSERRRLAALGRVARRWPLAPRGACLRHSLAAAHVVRSRDPRLRLSVGRTSPGQIAAHAWIEVNGTAVTDPGDFEPLARRKG
jgi:hypothetical protein